MDSQQKIISISPEQLSEPITVTVGDLAVMINMLDVLSRRGVFLMEDFVDIGKLYKNIKSALHTHLKPDTITQK